MSWWYVMMICHGDQPADHYIGLPGVWKSHAWHSGVLLCRSRVRTQALTFFYRFFSGRSLWHIIMTYANDVSQWCKRMTYHHDISPWHMTMISMIYQYYIWMIYTDDISQWHILVCFLLQYYYMTYHHDISPWHISMIYHHYISQWYIVICHAHMSLRMSWWYVMRICHVVHVKNLVSVHHDIHAWHTLMTYQYMSMTYDNDIC